MRVEVLTIGDELLEGLTLDRNAAWLGRALAARGLRVQRSGTLPDRVGPLQAEFTAIAARADVCIVTGGLGPTDDDLTLATLAGLAGAPLIEDAEILAWLTERYAARHGAALPAHVRRMALVPVGGRALPPQVGAAPGIELAHGGCTFYLLPGVPREMRWHFSTHVEPALAARGAAGVHTRRLQFALVGESRLASGLPPFPEAVTVAFRARGPLTELRLSGADAAQVDAAAEQAIASAAEGFIGEGEADLAQAALAACAARGLTLGTAESCTGGLVGGALTGVPGSSSVFSGGIISYANAVKRAALGVPAEVLETDGAVSEACALAMAQGARAALGVDVAVAITGIAGPGGGSADKPVGTVWFAWAGPGFLHATRLQLPGDRDRVRAYAVAHALDGVRRRLD